VTCSITFTSDSSPRTIGAPFSPTAVSAMPKKTEKITIGSTSFLAIASMIETGTRWTKKSWSEKGGFTMPLASVTGGKGRPRPTPGWNRLTNRRPSESETRLASTNQPIDRAPIRPSAEVSPICAMPATSVPKINGAMIILIRRRKMSVRIEKPVVIVARSAGSDTVWLRTNPVRMPMSIARRM
jgi:hypothetical protein